MASGTMTRTGEAGDGDKRLLEGGTRYSRAGTLQFRDVTVDPATGSVVLRMVFPNPDTVLLPGMFVRAIVEEGVLEQAILAPQQGVSRVIHRIGLPAAKDVNALSRRVEALAARVGTRKPRKAPRRASRRAA